MKARHYIATGVLAYILFLVASTPATTAYLFNEQLPHVKLQGLKGTLWNGSAQRVIISSKHILDDVSWSFCAWRLLTGELCLELDAYYQDNPFYGQVGKGLGGSVRVRDLVADIDAKTLGKLLEIPLGELSGNLSIEVASASWNQGSAPTADGLITWNDAAITVAETAKLGTMSIVLSESDNFPLNATITNKGGDIAIDGNANAVDDGTYNVELNLTPNSQATKNVRKSLEMFAQKQPNGSFIIKNSGNLDQLGLM